MINFKDPLNDRTQSKTYHIRPEMISCNINEIFEFGEITTDMNSPLKAELHRLHETIKYTTKNTDSDQILWKGSLIYQIADESNIFQYWIIKKTHIEIREYNEDSPLVRELSFNDLQSIDIYKDHVKFLYKLVFKFITIYALRQQALPTNKVIEAFEIMQYCFLPYKCGNRQILSRTIDCHSNLPFIERYSIDKKSVLGSGQFGIVYEAFDFLEQMPKAVKVLKSRTSKNELKKEFDITRELDCVNILRIEAIGTDNSGTVMIAMELCGLDYLDFILKINGGRICEDLAKFYTFQLLNGLLFIHQNNIIHRDIKPENLLMEIGVGEYCLHGLMKISDFGLSNKAVLGPRSTYCGSEQYQAPEITNEEKYDTRADVWAMGVVHYSSMVGFYPFVKNEEKTIEYLLQKNTGLNLYSDQANDFFKCIFVKQTQRMRSHRLITSNYFRTNYQYMINSFKKLLESKSRYTERQLAGIEIILGQLMRN